MSRPALLDVNVLVALFDPDHVHHETAHDWFSDNRARGWATCPLTENAFLRLSTHPTLHATLARAPDVLERLRLFRREGHHTFWPDVLSLTDDTLFDPAHFGSHRHITDIYLLGLAEKHGGRLATFDRTIPAKAVKGGARALEIIATSE